ncbi:MAG: helix-turn-helix transcriptional regulator [Acetatifactor sp.]
MSMEMTNCEMRKNLGNNIHRERIRHNLTIEALAEALDVSTQAIHKWQKGDSYPEPPKMLKLSKLFGTSIEQLLTGNAQER